MTPTVTRATPRQEDQIVLSAIALALIGVTLVELLVTWVSHSSIPVPRRVFFAENNVWLFAPVGFVVALFCAPLGKGGVIASAAALTLLVLVVLNFRGMWVWPGTFDRFEQSPYRWIMPLILGAITGMLLWMVPPTHQVRGIHRAHGWTALLLGLSGVAAFAFDDAHIMGSAWPPTRFIALAVVLVLVLVAGMVER